MAHILILSVVFPPDRASTAHIIAGLAGRFIEKGNKVTVITTTPHNNIFKDPSLYDTEKSYFFNVVQKSSYNGIVVYRILMGPKSKNKLKRIFWWGWFSFVSCIVPLFLRNRFDLVFACSPPLSIGISADFISRMKKIPFIYNVQEIYPDIAVLSGAVRNKLLILFLLKLENYIYNRSSHVTVIGDFMQNKLIEKGVNKSKLSVIPNYADPIFFNRDIQSSFREELNMNNKFIFGYAGNFGIAQDMRLIIELARRFVNNDDVHFLLAGGGIFYNEALIFIKKYNLKNITMLGYIEHKRMPEFYSSVDVLFVTLKPEVAQAAFPSKVIEIMACGKPIIGITNQKSDLAHIIIKAGCGFVVEPQDFERLYKIAISCIYNINRLNELGENGLKYIKKYNSFDLILKNYLELFRRINSKV